MNTESQQQIAVSTWCNLHLAGLTRANNSDKGIAIILSAIERAMQANKDDLAQGLFTAWSKYVQLFGEQPHGTLKQLRAMLEFYGNTDHQ